LAVKGALDRVAAIVMLLPALPVIGFLIVAIRLTSKGPGVYSQPRVGKGGRPFVMYKLRSMRIDAEAKTGPVWSSSLSDPRVTPLGYWLRRLHLDELPQLFNVLKGDMSLIGPRPERPEFVKVLADQIEHYTERLRIAPGITGLAQVNLPPDTDIDSVRRKLMLDREYLETASFSLDARIVLCTLLRVVGVRGGLGVKWLGLHRTVELPDAVAPIGGDHEAAPATPHSIALADSSPANQSTRDTVPVKTVAGLADTVVTESRRAPRPATVPLPVASEA
jgi:lipopolysaccharide/colanic/teichoic acid biosynthesis glycosyltransferase